MPIIKKAGNSPFFILMVGGSLTISFRSRERFAVVFVAFRLMKNQPFIVAVFSEAKWQLNKFVCAKIIFLIIRAAITLIDSLVGTKSEGC